MYRAESRADYTFPFLPSYRSFLLLPHNPIQFLIFRHYMKVCIEYFLLEIYISNDYKLLLLKNLLIHVNSQLSALKIINWTALV